MFSPKFAFKNSSRARRSHFTITYFMLLSFSMKSYWVCPWPHCISVNSNVYCFQLGRKEIIMLQGIILLQTSNWSQSNFNINLHSYIPVGLTVVFIQTKFYWPLIRIFAASKHWWGGHRHHILSQPANISCAMLAFANRALAFSPASFTRIT